MEQKSIPLNLISIVVGFIESHDLGPTAISIFDGKQKRDYNSTEKRRLNKLLVICENLINKKLDINNIQSLIKNELEIDDNLSFEIAEKIKKEIEKPQEEKIDNLNELDESKEVNLEKMQANKNSIFSRLIK